MSTFTYGVDASIGDTVAFATVAAICIIAGFIFLYFALRYTTVDYVNYKRMKEWWDTYSCVSFDEFARQMGENPHSQNIQAQVLLLREQPNADQVAAEMQTEALNKAT